MKVKDKKNQVGHTLHLSLYILGPNLGWSRLFNIVGQDHWGLQSIAELDPNHFEGSYLKVKKIRYGRRQCGHHTYNIRLDSAREERKERGFLFFVFHCYYYQ